MTPTPHQSSGVEGQLYLIRKGAFYYRPKSCGYTNSRDEAGRYSLSDAIRLTHPNGPDGPRDELTYELAPAMSDQEKRIRHDERKRIIAAGCIHTRKAADQDGNGDRADIVQWQTDNKQWFDATICEIVSEYADWRDTLPIAPTTAAKTLHALGLLTDADVGRIGNTLAARERVRQGGQGA